jgi:hypothetical protein
MMANQNPPSFDDLQPEGEDIEVPGDPGNAGEYREPYLDAAPMGALGEYEFEDLEEFVDLDTDDDFFGNGHRKRSRDTLAGLAAHIALKWASRSTSRSSVNGKRRPSGTSRHAGPSSRRLEAEYLSEPDTHMVGTAATLDEATACSAGLLEEYELMEALAATAASTESRAEAERLVAALAPISIRLAPQIYRALWPTLPTLMQGVAGVTRLLHSRRATRPLIESVPAILQSTVAQLARHAEQGQPITGRLVAKVLSRQTGVALQQHRPGPAAVAQRRSVRSKRSPRWSYDPYGSEEWWDDGFGA